MTGRFGQRAVNSMNRPEVHGVYRDWRRIADSYADERLLLGETWVSGPPGQLLRPRRRAAARFNFPFVFAGLSAPALSGVVAQTLAKLPASACPVWTSSNHDVGRFPSRWCDGDEPKIRLALLVLATLPGTTVLYYGDEIGMTDVRSRWNCSGTRCPGVAKKAGGATGTGPAPPCSGTARPPRASPPPV